MRQLICLLAVIGCSKSPPTITMVTPTTLCANVESKLMLLGSDLDPKSVEIGASMDMGPPAVAASSVSGTGASTTATFAKGSLTASDSPLDVTIINQDGQRFTLKGAVTVAAGISLAAVDPAFVWNGADFPTSFYGIGMGGVKTISITDAGGTVTELMGVTPIDANRADAVVPKGLPAGPYSVKVTDQDGCTAELASGALTVVGEVTVSVCAIDPTFGYDMVSTDVSITSTSDGKPGSATCDGKMAKFVSTPRAWLSVAGVLQPLENVAFVSEGGLTATVPKGLTVNDTTPYDLIVQNPDGAVGVLSMAFKVVSQPVPRITSIDPPTLPVNTAKPLKIFGQNFRDPVKVEVYAKGGPMITLTGATVASAGEIDFASVTAGTFGLTADTAYTVRVTDTDQGTFAELFALAVISDSLNLPSWTDQSATSALPQKTMRAGAAGGQVSPAARYLYVVGGDSGGAAPTRYDVTQIGVVDKFGDIARWITGRYKLPAARTWLQLIAAPAASGAGGHLYAIGGDESAGAVNKVSRAHILLPSEAPPITKSTVSLGGTLARGAWYYRVSAVLDMTDPQNPLGETLPSQEVTAHTVEMSQVKLEWSAVAHAASYNVYRTATVDGSSKSEVLFKSGVTDTSFLDDGSLTPEGGTPLEQGELGVWVDMPALNDARRAGGAAIAHDPSGAAYLYAVGGDNANGLGNALPGGAVVYDTYEYAPLTDDGLTLGAWTRDTTNKLTQARTRTQSPVGEHATSQKVPVNDAYVYVVAGLDGGNLVDFYSSAKVAAGGLLGAWSARTAASASQAFYPGLASLIASDQLFAIGGVDATGAPQTDAASVPYATPPAFASNISNDPSLKVNSAGMPVAAYGMLVFSSGHLYMLGGTSGSDALTRLWTVVY